MINEGLSILVSQVRGSFLYSRLTDFPLKNNASNKICIPSPPPDLDCKDIPYRQFVVLKPDPHTFDSDKDGIGCESQQR